MASTFEINERLETPGRLHLHVTSKHISHNTNAGTVPLSVFFSKYSRWSIKKKLLFPYKPHLSEVTIAKPALLTH